MNLCTKGARGEVCRGKMYLVVYVESSSAGSW